MNRIRLSAFAALAGTMLAGTVILAAPASAAQCFYQYGGGSPVISACGTWNSSSTSLAGWNLTQTHSFVWTVKLLDSQYRLTSTKIKTYGYNPTCPSGTATLCRTFTTGSTTYNKSPLTGTWTIVPVWYNKYGLTIGAARGQSSNVDISYCRGTACYSTTLGNLGFGPL